ncbi:leucine-rich repeat domain-containing protein [Listeria ivanovii]|uniref:leucine-rich repeat domain-containing protein n=1 Tax=Listeria ivanovii TaxID=1638 RepID=UPI00068B4742|nr:leucine-rich repeat domain-containing protein [Listeria ivanovii]MBK1967699.1 leucine-rich repeat domain-containing protein [Listeria ivanovii subsp. londoniensis]MBK1985907.1 leucine-rich repeat domain-containing protein [Listeria ivanovii subsp. londoniensis]MBK1997258.1 leucine-rich repeat domain-containing protein [Listeria ivanovii subsp. londoniensis]
MNKKECLKNVIVAILLAAIFLCVNTSLGAKVQAVNIKHPMPINQIFPDSNLAEEMQIILRKKSVTDVVTQQELDSLRQVSADNKGIQSVEGIQYLTNLQVLYLSGNQITDISPLASLKKLAVLDLGKNKLHDISDIKKIANSNPLSDLLLGDNEITDISPLANLTNLENLSLKGNKLSNIQILPSLTSLEELDLRENQLRDIRGLEKLKNMERLLVSEQRCVNEPVDYQPNLLVPNTFKDMEGKLVVPSYISNDGTYTDGKLIWHLPEYTEKVSCSFNKVVTVGKTTATFHGVITQPLQRKAAELEISKPIDQIFPDVNLAEIVKRSLRKKHITEMVSQVELNKIYEIHADNKDIHSIEGLQYLPNLKRAFLSDNHLSNIRSLKNSIHLKELYLDNNDLTDENVSELINLSKLETLSIKDNKISGLTARNLMNHLMKLEEFNWSKK